MRPEVLEAKVHTNTMSQFAKKSSSHIKLTNVSAVAGGRQLFTGLTLAVDRGSRLALVGENGRGKSTLLRLMLDQEPDAGEILRQGQIALVAQGLDTGQEQERTVGDLVAEAAAEPLEALAELETATQLLAEGAPGADAAYGTALGRALDLEAWDAERKITLALEGLGACTDRHRKLSSLSVGQRYRVRLAVMLGSEPDILLLDEPTNHLDASALAFLTQKLRGYPGALVLVSHDRTLLADTAETFLDLDPTLDGAPRSYSGGYRGWVQGRDAYRSRWEQLHTRQKAEEALLEEAVENAQARLIDGWRPPKGTGKHQRSTRAAGSVQSFNRRLEDLETHRVTVPPPPLPLCWPPSTTVAGAPLLQVQEVEVAGRLEAGVSLNLSGGDRLLITGANGAGKSTLLAVLAGELAPTRGRVSFAPDAHLAVLTQEIPAWNRAHTAEQIYRTEIDRSGALARHQQVPELCELGILEADALGTQLGRLSQGQQRRLHLAVCLAQKPDLLLLDEPTNHLSMGLVDDLTEAFDTVASALAVVSHDRQMLADLAHWQKLELKQE